MTFIALVVTHLYSMQHFHLLSVHKNSMHILCKKKTTTPNNFKTQAYVNELCVICTSTCCIVSCSAIHTPRDVDS